MNTLQRHSALLASAAILATSSLSAVTTDVVGYTSISIPSGSGTVVAPAFVNSASESGSLVGAVSGATSTLTTPTLSGGAAAYNKSTDPAPRDFPLFYLEVLNDTAADGLDTEGLILDIVSNTATEVVVAGNAAALGIQGDENFIIRKHVTIGDISVGATGFNAFDILTIYNGSSVGSVDSYAADGANGWTDFSLNPASNAPIHPGTGVVFNTAGAVTLVVDGTVKESATQVPVYANQPNLVGVMKPLSSFDTASDGAVQDALEPFDAITIYADGTFTASTVFNNLTDDGYTTNGVDSVPLVIDGTQQTLVVSTGTDTVYKASGTVIP